MRETHRVTETALRPSSSTVHAWERLSWLWPALFYVTLAVPTVSASTSAESLGRRVAVLAAVVGVAAAREAAVRSVARVEEGGARQIVVGLAWAALTVAALVPLVDADRVFFFSLYGLFPQAFLILPRNWAIGVGAALFPVVIVGVEGVSALHEGDVVTSALGSALIALAIGVFIDGISRQSEERHQALIALEAANAEAESLLRASLAVARARTAEEVVAALGECLTGHGVRTVALWADGVQVATWTAAGGDPADNAAAAQPATLELPVAASTLGAHAHLAVRVSPAAGAPPGRRTLETLAASCALALENLHLVERAREGGVAEERARLAREIHDTLAQGFVSVLTQLEAADEALAEAPPEVVERVRRAEEIARANLDEARRSVRALRPVALESAPLPEAIERVVRRWSEDSRLDASVAVSGAPVALPSGTEVTLLRAVQEALANVSRHADARSVAVSLSFLHDAVAVAVRDDGRGFEPPAVAASGDGGFGLEGLRQRAEDAGGCIDVDSRPGVGTTLTVRLPLTPVAPRP